mgnify:CR=1 FL=1
MHVYTQEVPAAPRAPKARSSIGGADSRGLSERERAVRGFRDAVDTKLLAALAELAKLGLVRATIGDNSAQAALDYMNSEYARWGKVIQAANISVR